MSFPKINHLLIEPKKEINLLGCAIKFTTIVNLDEVDTARVTIKDPSNIEKVNAANMTKDANRIYSYIWQSHEDNDTEGLYEVIVEMISGSYTAIEKKIFEMKDPEIDD